MLALFAALTLTPFLPSAVGLQPTARWGHQAVYVPSEHSMYVIGGQVQTPGTQITNEVLVLPLNGTNPSYASGPSGNLPPHAFAGATVSHDGQSIVVVGGLSSDCASDAVGHVYNDGAWSDVEIDNLVRRRGAALAAFDDGGSGKMLLVGGIADTYTCASTANAYPANDVLSSPLTSSSLLSTSSLPSDLTGSSLAVSDSAVAMSPDHKTMYIIGGQAADGSLAPMNTMGMWTPSDGWKSQPLGGTAPVGRIGATLVAHPSLDLLVLHGGARNDRGSDLSTTLLAFVNTTTWEWSIPSHLQPPQVSAVSYHSAVMTPEGVMISAFGLNAEGSPRADTYFLDLRDPTQDGWTWKGQWNADMLTTVATEVSAPKKNIASIVAPVVILVIILPLVVFLIRRQVRINRKRRQARHFSFSSQEDEGEFKRGRAFPWIGRRGSDGNEKTWMQDAQSNAQDLYRRLTGHKAQKSRGEKSWEEIDFGLGRVDERARVRTSRDSSFSAPDSAPFTDRPSMAMANGVTYTPPVHVYAPEPSDLPYTVDPFSDGYAEDQVIPALTIQPPTAHPTPAAQPTEAFPVPQPLIPSTPPRPVSGLSDDAHALDWSALEQSLNDRPAFRSISPTSTLRSHQPGHQLPERRSSIPSPKPSLPPLNLDFGPRRSVSNSRPQSMIVAGSTPRSVSSPVSGRQIAGSIRRHSADVQDSPAQSLASPVSSGYGTPQISTAVRFDARTVNMARSASAEGKEYGSLPRNRPMSALRIANPSDSDSDEQV